MVGILVVALGALVVGAAGLGWRLAALNRGLRRSLAAKELLAYRDPLTGLPNRLALEAALTRACARPRQPVTVLIMDVDRFREVNDSFGHRAGDELLRVVTDRLREISTPDVLLARLGGDEFAAVIEGDVRQGRVGELLESMEGAALLLGGSRIDVTVSCGVATGTGGDVEADVLLHRADLALHAAKRRGVSLAEWQPAMGQRTAERLAMLSDLRTAVADEEIELYVQPAVSLEDDRVTGVEVLLRWNHPEHGVLGPDAFVPLAEQCDIIHALTGWTLDRAVAAAAQWNREGRDLTVSVNISPRDLTPELPARVRATLARHRLPAGRLTIELTETCLPTSMETAADVLGEIGRLGVKVAVDDFGTGFATLAWLRRLSFTELKIDRSFVGDLLRQPAAEELVRHVIALGHGLGMRVTAEGVERMGQEQILRDLGCDLVQGFAHAAPMPVEDFPAWLAAREPTSAHEHASAREHAPVLAAS